ncbi:MAG TPA: YbaB/EbfC family nucleoid-associated protein [Gemmatimonadales bacterium]|nr:YbaB/EbfC family nucleoid-associated protein [Gemmatimonadales bacterium]
MADLQTLGPLGPQVQGRLLDLQSELSARQIEGSAGGGLVRVTADGRGTIRDVRIDPEAFTGRDAELLADLVLGAVADAQRRAAEELKAEMGRLPGSAGS